MAARARTQTPAPRSDIYVGLLVLAFLAQVTGFTFLLIDWASYPASKPAIPAQFKPPAAPVAP
jgi:hypothetical protein